MAIGAGGSCPAITSSASTAPRAAPSRDFRGVTAPTRVSITARTAASGVRRAMRCALESSIIADMIRMTGGFDDSQKITEKPLNLRGLKCPLPALRARKALGGLAPGDVLI